jgi:hypothetical protein
MLLVFLISFYSFQICDANTSNMVIIFMVVLEIFLGISLHYYNTLVGIFVLVVLVIVPF